MNAFLPHSYSWKPFLKMNNVARRSYINIRNISSSSIKKSWRESQTCTPAAVMRESPKFYVSFLESSINILQIIDKNMNEVLILEDDIRFGKYFIHKLERLIREIHNFASMWDLIYIGRKIMKPNEESYLNGSDILVYPDYTYWTIGYILNRIGAEKLVNAEPLSKLLPVDEFLPIMYDKHPRRDWKAHFPTRKLRALSVNPLIIFPMKYTNEEGYVSDTEDSQVVNEKEIKSDEL